MTAQEIKTITIKTLVNASPKTVWKLWNEPSHITKWNAASPDWHSPSAENDVKPGGKFTISMEAKDGSFGFDFSGIYNEVRINEYLSYTLDDSRKVEINFESVGDQTEITETFEAENTNPLEMQRGGWQSILDNFKSYAEANK